MTDLSQTIAPKSDQLNADDLIAGPRTIKVTEVRGHENDDQPVSVFFEGDNGKPYKPCKSMRRVLVQVWGPDGATYPGRSMTLYNDPEVKFGGIKVGGIRISHMSHIDRTASLMLTTTRARRNEYRVQPLATDQDGKILLRAQEEADKGKDAFIAFWQSDEGKKNRDALRPHLNALQKRAEDADQANMSLAQKLQQQTDEIEQQGVDETAETESEASPPPPDQEPEFDNQKVDPFADEYSEGVKARQAGMKPEMNPFTPGDPSFNYDSWNNWIGGYRFAEKQEKKGEES